MNFRSVCFVRARSWVMGLFFKSENDDPDAGSPVGRREPTLSAGPAPSATPAGRDYDARRPGGGLMPRAVAAAMALSLVWFCGMLVYYTIKFPDPMAVQANKTPTIRILARDGGLLAERGSKHPYIPIDLLPGHVVDAVVAIEDRRFYEHYGIDASGLMRAAFANLRAGRYAQGGSTLTQQLAKNLYLSSERTLMRKLEELTLAIWLELRLDKHDILELYLNQVYFGSGAYGIEAAAQRHFGKSASALSLVEGAVLAGLLKAPSRYSPSSDPVAARNRGRVVLRAMSEAGKLSDTQLKSALNTPVRFARRDPGSAVAGTEYAIDFILDRMPPLLTSEEPEIIVETSLDAALQDQAQRALTETLRSQGHERSVKQGAIAVIDSTGGIRALVGGNAYSQSEFNRATSAMRQPGSSFKPFVYLAALENGMTPESVSYDVPVEVSGWSPKNSNGAYRGEVTLRHALAKSINTVAVRLALDVGLGEVTRTANRAGIRSQLRADPSLALGTSEVSLLELTGAYVPFANGGRRVDPHIIRRVRNVSGRVLYASSSAASDVVIELRHVGAMNDMLNAALVEGTGAKAALDGHPAAGKTGTSQGFRDAWFIGYTAHLTAGVWLGNDDASPMRQVVGGSLPAEIWRQVMAQAHRPLAPLPLPGTSRPGSRTLPAMAQAPRGTPRSDAGPRARKISNTRPAVTPLPPARKPPLAAVRKSVPKVHPRERISADFIARAIEAVPPAQGSASQPATHMAGSSNGFDIGAIRARLRDTPAGKGKTRPSMALGGPVSGQ